MYNLATIVSHIYHVKPLKGIVLGVFPLLLDFLSFLLSADIVYRLPYTLIMQMIIPVSH